jgi:hypothetical protein
MPRLTIDTSERLTDDDAKAAFYRINREGKTITTVFVEIDADIAVLRIKSGREYRYPIKNFADGDQNLIASLTQKQ